MAPTRLRLWPGPDLGLSCTATVCDDAIVVFQGGAAVVEGRDAQPEQAPDFAVAAYREEGRWVCLPLRAKAGGSIDTLVAALHQLPAQEGALALVCFDDDFSLIVRVQGRQVRLVLSDVTAAEEWRVAAEALEHCGGPLPGVEQDPVPVGDLGMLADLGLGELDLSMLCEDPDLYPDELLADVATRLGFGEDFDRVLDSAR